MGFIADLSRAPTRSLRLRLLRVDRLGDLGLGLELHGFEEMLELDQSPVTSLAATSPALIDIIQGGPDGRPGAVELQVIAAQGTIDVATAAVDDQQRMPVVPFPGTGRQHLVVIRRKVGGYVEGVAELEVLAVFALDTEGKDLAQLRTDDQVAGAGELVASGRNAQRPNSGSPG